MEILEVDRMDYTLTDDGKYKKEYWGKIIVDNTGGWIIVDEDGYAKTLTKDEWINLFKHFKNREEVKSKPTISDLLKLKEKFTVDEIIRLKNEGLI